jgi:hypothetical protein
VEITGPPANVIGGEMVADGRVSGSSTVGATATAIVPDLTKMLRHHIVTGRFRWMEQPSGYGGLVDCDEHVVARGDL